MPRPHSRAPRLSEHDRPAGLDAESVRIPAFLGDMRNPSEIIGSLGFPPVTGVLQVGANTGQEVPLFLANGVQTATLIEPLDGPFSALKERCAGLPGYVLAQALCGPKDGEEVEFHIASNN